MDIATWNINGIKARLDTLLAWLKEAEPDICCLQEIKSVDEAFPSEPIEALGYNVATHGQKGFNGVAILAKRPLEDISIRLPGDDSDEQARFMEATVAGETQTVRVAALYLPNGNPVGGEKYTYKLAWMDRLIAHAGQQLAKEENYILAGDYNVIPTRKDAKKPDDWTNDALFLPQTLAKFRSLTALGFTDAVRVHDDSAGIYSFWDYQAGAWQRNNGIRIDHLMLSPQAADLLIDCRIDKHVRGWDKPSDHVPVIAKLEI